MITIKKEDKYSLRISTVTFLNDNILKIVFKDGSHIEWADIMEIFMLTKIYGKPTKKIYALTVWGQDCTWEKEAREVMASDTFYENICGEAVVLDSLAHKLIFNFTKQYFRPKRLMEMFADENKAMNWLLTLIESENELVSSINHLSIH